MVTDGDEEPNLSNNRTVLAELIDLRKDIELLRKKMQSEEATRREELRQFEQQVLTNNNLLLSELTSIMESLTSMSGEIELLMKKIDAKERFEETPPEQVFDLSAFIRRSVVEELKMCPYVLYPVADYEGKKTSDLRPDAPEFQPSGTKGTKKYEEGGSRVKLPVKDINNNFLNTAFLVEDRGKQFTRGDCDNDSGLSGSFRGLQL